MFPGNTLRHLCGKCVDENHLTLHYLQDILHYCKQKLFRPENEQVTYLLPYFYTGKGTSNTNKTDNSMSGLPHNNKVTGLKGGRKNSPDAGAGKRILSLVREGDDFDRRYRYVKSIYLAGDLRTFGDIFGIVPRSIVAGDIMLNYDRFTRKAGHPELLKYSDMLAISKLTGIPPQDLSALIVDEIVENTEY